MAIPALRCILICVKPIGASCWLRACRKRTSRRSRTALSASRGNSFLIAGKAEKPDAKWRWWPSNRVSRHVFATKKGNWSITQLPNFLTQFLHPSLGCHAYTPPVQKRKPLLPLRTSLMISVSTGRRIARMAFWLIEGAVPSNGAAACFTR